MFCSLTVRNWPCFAFSLIIYFGVLHIPLHDGQILAEHASGARPIYVVNRADMAQIAGLATDRCRLGLARVMSCRRRGSVMAAIALLAHRRRLPHPPFGNPLPSC